MKKSLFFFLCLVVFSFSARGQAEYATTASDQVIQGPCYIFVTLAALESKILESNPGIASTLDLYEWNLYSIDILGTRSGFGHTMVEKVLAHAKNKGVYTRADNFVPTSEGDIPNENDGLVPGIVEFQNCSNDFADGDITYEFNDFEGTCLDDDNKKFQINDIQGDKYTYSYSGLNGYVLDSSPTVSEMKAHLDEGRGLIAFFTDWGPDEIGHAVFIHGYTGNDWHYKNSWPGAAVANETGTLDIGKCTDFYYLTGTVTLDNGASCSADISGPVNHVTQYATYNLLDSGTPVTGISWSLSSNLTVVTQNGSGITVKANNCSLEDGYIVASYTNAGTSCQVTRTLTVNGGAQTPSSIAVLSHAWNPLTRTTCPGTVLELQAIDNNPGTPTTTYEWNIAGASILSGQGTETLFVQTPFGSGTSNLTFKVRAKNGTCAYSPWETLYGTSDPSHCGGGGFLFSANNKNLTVENLNGLVFEPNQVKYDVITLSGTVMNEGFIEPGKTVIDIKGIKQKVVILRVYDPVSGFYQSGKYYIK